MAYGGFTAGKAPVAKVEEKLPAPSMGAVCVTPHAPLTAPQVQYELADSGCNWLFVSTRGQLDKIDQVRSELPELRGIVSFDPLDGDHECFQVQQIGREELGEQRSQVLAG